MDMPEEPRNAFPALYESSSDENAEMENYKNTEVEWELRGLRVPMMTFSRMCQPRWIAAHDVNASAWRTDSLTDNPAIGLAIGRRQCNCLDRRQWMKYGLEHDPDLRSVKATRVPANIDCPSLSRHDVQFNWSKERTETPHHRGPGKAAVRDRDDDLADDEEDVVHPQFGSRPRLKKGHRKNRFSSQPPAAGKQRASTTVSESSVKWVASTVQPGPPRHSFNYAASGSQPTHAPAPTYQASPPPMISSPPPMVLEHPLSTAMTQAPASFAIPVRSGSVVNSVPVEVGLAQQPPKPMTAPKSRRGRRPTATASAESFVCPLHMCGARYRGASGLYYHLRTRHPEYNIRELGVRKHREKNTR